MEPAVATSTGLTRPRNQPGCSICRETGHYGTTCNSPIIEEKTDLIGLAFQDCIIIGIENNPGSALMSRTIKHQIKCSFRNITREWSLIIWKRVFAKFESRFSRSSPSNRPLYRNFIRMTTDENTIHPRTTGHYGRLLYKFAFYVVYKERNMIQTMYDVHFQLEDPSVLLTTPVDMPPVPSLAGGAVSPVPIIHSDTLFDSPRIDDAHMPLGGYSPPPAPRRRRTYDHKPSVQICMDPVGTEYIREETCPICIEPLKDNMAIALGCRHSFCAGCAGQFIKRCNGKCPSCREHIKKVHFQASILPEHFNALMELIQ